MNEGTTEEKKERNYILLWIKLESISKAINSLERLSDEIQNGESPDKIPSISESTEKQSPMSLAKVIKEGADTAQELTERIRRITKELRTILLG